MPLPKALGFIGLGTMGLPMAKTLLKKCTGSYLYVYDINSEAMESFAAENPDSVTTCPNPRAVADRAVSCTRHFSHPIFARTVADF